MTRSSRELNRRTANPQPAQPRLDANPKPEQSRADRQSTSTQLQPTLALAARRGMGSLLLGSSGPLQRQPMAYSTLAKLSLVSATLIALHVTLLHVSNAPPREYSSPVLLRLGRRSFSGQEPPGDEPTPSAAMIDWEAIWAAASPQLRPLVFLVMVGWLVFLFAFVGITASVSRPPFSGKTQTGSSPARFPRAGFLLSESEHNRQSTRLE